MPTLAGFGSGGFVEKISPGGPYFKYARAIAIGLGLVFTGLLIALFYPQIKNLFVKEPPQPPSKVTCAPADPLPKGFQEIEFSHGKDVVGPKIQTGTIDTLTPREGSSQTLTLVIKHDAPVTEAKVTVNTDSGSQTYDLKLTKGTDTDGTWVGSWVMNDSYECVYHFSFVLKSNNGTWTGTLTYR